MTTEISRDYARPLRACPRVELEPLVARRTLRFELERLCADTGVRHDTVATWLGVSRPAASTALACKSLLSRPALEVVLKRLDRSEWFARLDSLLSAARSRGGPQTSTRSAVPHDVELAIGLEAFADKVSVFDPWSVPVHLQTETYAAVTNQDKDAEDASRQRRLAPLWHEHDPLGFRWVTTEHALHRRVGSLAVMRDQLAHLLTLAGRPNVDILVVPATTDVNRVGGRFQIISGTPSVVCESTHLQMHYAHETDVVSYFDRLLVDVERQALCADASRALIAGLLEQPGRSAVAGSNRAGR